MMRVKTVAEGMADNFIRHHPLMPSAGKMAENLGSAGRLKDSLHSFPYDNFLAWDETCSKGRRWYAREMTVDTDALIAEIYAAFNRRNVDKALSLMSEDVDWPKASEGGRVIGKDAVRAYWTRQWAEFDPHVEPIEVIERGAAGVDVRVHQVVKDLKGVVLSDQVILHVFCITNDLITRMDIHDSRPAFQ